MIKYLKFLATYQKSGKLRENSGAMAENEGVIDRIKYIIKEMRVTQHEFAKRVGVDPSNLSKYLKGRLPVNDSLVNRIVVNLGLSKEWLTTGGDLPYAKVAPTAESGFSGQISRGAGRGTPVYDIDVTAGSMPRSRMFAQENIVGYVNVPSIPPGCRIVGVSGDSMQPVIRSGDLLAVRELTNLQQIFWGHIYVVLLDDYCMVKYVRRHSDPDKVILRSENPNYDDMEIERAEIRDLMFVQHILHVDTRM